MLWDNQELKLQPAGQGCKLRALLYGLSSIEDMVMPRALAFAGFEVSRICEIDKLWLRIENEKPDLVVIPASVVEAVNITTLLEGIASACATEALPVLVQCSELISWDGGNIVCENIPNDTNLATVFFLSRSIVRRVRPWSLTDTRQFGALELCEDRFRIQYAGRSAALGKLDFNILGTFFDAPDHVFDRETLLRLAFGEATAKNVSRLVDVRMCALRNLLKKSLMIDPIETIRGVGYKLVRIG